MKSILRLFKTYLIEAILSSLVTIYIIYNYFTFNNYIDYFNVVILQLFNFTLFAFYKPLICHLLTNCVKRKP